MTGRQDVFQQAMNQGHSAAWDQMWEKAAGHYRKALQEFPDNPQALTSLGLALIELQEFDEAMRCYQRAARLLPQDPLPLEKIAQLAERLGNLDMGVQASLRAADLHINNRDVAKAVENWERAIRLNPENMQAHSRLAMIFERTGDKNRAVTEYLIVASLLQSSGQLEKAKQVVDRALVVVPKNPEALQALTLLKDFKPLPRPSRPKGSTAPLRMAQVRQLQSPQTDSAPQEIDPVMQARQKALTVLAGMLFEGIEEEENTGRRDLQSIVSGMTGMLNRPVDRTRMILHLSQVVDLQARNENTQAAEELQRAIDMGLDSPAALFNLGYLYYLGGRVESAIRQLQRSVKSADFALGSHLLLGELQRKKGQTREAALDYMEALKLADAQMVPAEQANDLIQLYGPLIETLRQRSDVAMYERICENVHTMLMRNDWRQHLSRAREQLPGQDRQGPAMPLAEILIEARSSQVIEAMTVIYDLLNLGNTRSAMEEAFYALEHAPTYLPIHSLMGDMLVKQGENQAASAKYLVVARTYAARGEAQQAINYSHRVVDLMPTDINARGRLIDQMLNFGMVSQALDEYMQLADVYYSLADLSMARKTYTDALRAAQNANVERSQRVKILHRMADIDMQSLDWRQAIRVLEQIRTLQPEDRDARYSLIQLNLRLGQEPQAMGELDNYISFMSSANLIPPLLKFMTGLVDEYPTNIPIRRRLADLYRLLGQVSQAVEQLDTLGDMLLEAGDRAGAIQTVETILSMAPPNREAYEQLLEQLRAG